MKIKHTDTRDGLVIIGLEDESGVSHEIVLNAMDTAKLLGALRASLEAAIGHPFADSMLLPRMVGARIVEHENEILFRVYMNERVSHDYPVPKNTYLADELKLLANRIAARNTATAAHQPPESPSG